MSKIVFLIICILGCITLAACGSRNSSNSDDDENSKVQKVKEELGSLSDDGYEYYDNWE